MQDHSLMLFFTVVVDVASVVLGFDMRRLNDVTAFRKCWYRKSVMESFMLGSHHKKQTKMTNSKKPIPIQKTTIPEQTTSMLSSWLSNTVLIVCFYSHRPSTTTAAYSCRDSVFS